MLLVELSKVFPKEMSKYRAIRSDPERPTWHEPEVELLGQDLDDIGF